MYTVNNVRFSAFEEVIDWAWENHKIEFFDADPLTEESKQEACREIEEILANWQE